MKKIAVAGIAIMMVISLYAVVVYAQTPTGQSPPSEETILAVTDLGKKCFNTVGFTDLWVLKIEGIGPARQVTGYDPVYPSAMNGGGQALPGTKSLLLTIDERAPGWTIFAEHNVELDTTTPGAWTGTDDLRWSDLSGVVYINYLDLPIQQVPCPAPGASVDNGPKTADKKAN